MTEHGFAVIDYAEEELEYEAETSRIILGILLAAVHASLLPKDTALADLGQLVHQGIRISPRWQEWFRREVEAR